MGTRRPREHLQTERLQLPKRVAELLVRLVVLHARS